MVYKGNGVRSGSVEYNNYGQSCYRQEKELEQIIYFKFVSCCKMAISIWQIIGIVCSVWCEHDPNHFATLSANFDNWDVPIYFKLYSFHSVYQRILLNNKIITITCGFCNTWLPTHWVLKALLCDSRSTHTGFRFNLGQPSRLVHTMWDQKQWIRNMERFQFLGVGGNRSAWRKPTKTGMESVNQIHIQPLASWIGERKVFLYLWYPPVLEHSILPKVMSILWWTDLCR